MHGLAGPPPEQLHDLLDSREAFPPAQAAAGQGAHGVREFQRLLNVPPLENRVGESRVKSVSRRRRIDHVHTEGGLPDKTLPMRLQRNLSRPV